MDEEQMCFECNRPSKQLILIVWMLWLNHFSSADSPSKGLTCNQMVGQSIISFACDTATHLFLTAPDLHDLVDICP